MSRAWSVSETMNQGVDRIRVGVAEGTVSNGDTPIVTSGLGSCVGVALYDGSGLGALLHAMLPEAPEDVDNPEKYVDSGLESLVDEMERHGANRRSIKAKLTGGSSMLDLGGDESVGDKNVRAAKQVLSDLHIDLLAEETGGGSGRSISFQPVTGVLTIKRVNADGENI